MKTSWILFPLCGLAATLVAACGQEVDDTDLDVGETIAAELDAEELELLTMEFTTTDSLGNEYAISVEYDGTVAEDVARLPQQLRIISEANAHTDPVLSAAPPREADADQIPDPAAVAEREPGSVSIYATPVGDAPPVVARVIDAVPMDEASGQDVDGTGEVQPGALSHGDTTSGTSCGSTISTLNVNNCFWAHHDVQFQPDPVCQAYTSVWHRAVDNSNVILRNAYYSAPMCGSGGGTMWNVYSSNGWQRSRANENGSGACAQISSLSLTCVH